MPESQAARFPLAAIAASHSRVPPPTAQAYARLSGSRSIAVPLRPGRTGCAPRHPLAIRIDSPLRAPATPTARIRGAPGGWHTKNPAEAGLVSGNATHNQSVADLLLQVLPAPLPDVGSPG